MVVKRTNFKKVKQSYQFSSFTILGLKSCNSFIHLEPGNKCFTYQESISHKSQTIVQSIAKTKKVTTYQSKAWRGHMMPKNSQWQRPERSWHVPENDQQYQSYNSQRHSRRMVNDTSQRMVINDISQRIISSIVREWSTTQLENDHSCCPNLITI